MRTSSDSLLKSVLGIAGLSSVLALLGVATAAPPPPPPRPVSPTQVLAHVGVGAGGSHGEAYLATGPNDGTDLDPASDRSLAPYLYVAGGDPDTVTGLCAVEPMYGVTT